MSGPYISENGDVVSSALNVSAGYADAREDLRESHGLLPGQIISIYTVDNPQNVPNGKGTLTVYDVQISHPDGTSEVIRRCQMLQPGFGGGMVNFCEIIPNDPGPKATKPNIAPALKRGSMVLIGFISGQKLRPIILGCLPHPSPVAVKTRPEKADGSIIDMEFQGLHTSINNDGELEIVFHGPRTDKGEPVDKTLGPTAIKIDKKGNIKASTNKKQSIEINRVTKKITVINDTISLVLDQEKEKVTLLCDNVEIEAKKDFKATVKGKAELLVTGDTTISSQSKIKLARGDAAPAEPYILGQKWVDFMTKLLNAIAGITHLGNLGAPTPPPLNASAISGMIGDLKDLLSDLIIGSK